MDVDVEEQLATFPPTNGWRRAVLPGAETPHSGARLPLLPGAASYAPSAHGQLHGQLSQCDLLLMEQLAGKQPKTGQRALLCPQLYVKGHHAQHGQQLGHRGQEHYTSDEAARMSAVMQSGVASPSHMQPLAGPAGTLPPAQHDRAAAVAPLTQQALFPAAASPALKQQFELQMQQLWQDPQQLFRQKEQQHQLQLRLYQQQEQQLQLQQQLCRQQEQPSSCQADRLLYHQQHAANGLRQQQLAGGVSSLEHLGSRLLSAAHPLQQQRQQQQRQQQQRQQQQRQELGSRHLRLSAAQTQQQQQQLGDMRQSVMQPQQLQQNSLFLAQAQRQQQQQLGGRSGAQFSRAAEVPSSMTLAYLQQQHHVPVLPQVCAQAAEDPALRLRQQAVPQLSQPPFGSSATDGSTACCIQVSAEDEPGPAPASAAAAGNVAAGDVSSDQPKGQRTWGQRYTEVELEALQRTNPQKYKRIMANRKSLAESLQRKKQGQKRQRISSSTSAAAGAVGASKKQGASALEERLLLLAGHGRIPQSPASAAEHDPRTEVLEQQQRSLTSSSRSRSCSPGGGCT